MNEISGLPLNGSMARHTVGCSISWIPTECPPSQYVPEHTTTTTTTNRQHPGGQMHMVQALAKEDVQVNERDISAAAKRLYGLAHCGVQYFLDPERIENKFKKYSSC